MASDTQVDTGRLVYLLVFHRALFKAHWSLLIPDSSEPGGAQKSGRRVDVQGTVAGGFTHAVQRDYDLRTESSTVSAIPIGVIPLEKLRPFPDWTPEEVGGPVARDEFEEAILKVAAPGPTLRSAATDSTEVRSIRSQRCEMLS